MQGNHNIDMEIDKRTWTMLGLWKGDSDANLMMYYGPEDYQIKSTTHSGLREPIGAYSFQILNTNIFLRQLQVYKERLQESQIFDLIAGFDPLRLSATSVLDILNTDASLFIDIEFGASLQPIDNQRFAGQRGHNSYYAVLGSNESIEGDVDAELDANNYVFLPAEESMLTIKGPFQFNETMFIAIYVQIPADFPAKSNLVTLYGQGRTYSLALELPNKVWPNESGSYIEIEPFDPQRWYLFVLKETYFSNRIAELSKMFEINNNEVLILEHPKMFTLDYLTIGPGFKNIRVRRVWIDGFLYGYNQFPNYGCPPTYYEGSGQECLKCQVEGCQSCLKSSPDQCEDQNQPEPLPSPPFEFSLTDFNSTTKEIQESSDKTALSPENGDQVHCDEFNGCLISDGNSYSVSDITMTESYSFVMWMRVTQISGESAILIQDVRILNSQGDEVIDKISIENQINWYNNKNAAIAYVQKELEPTWLAVAGWRKQNQASLLLYYSSSNVHRSSVSLPLASYERNAIRLKVEYQNCIWRQFNLYGTHIGEVEAIRVIKGKIGTSLEFQDVNLFSTQIQQFHPTESLYFDLEFGDSFIGSQEQVYPSARGVDNLGKLILGQSQESEEQDANINNEGFLELSKSQSKAVLEGPFSSTSLQIAVYFQIPQNSTKHKLLSLHSRGAQFKIELEAPNRVYLDGSDEFIEEASFWNEAQNWNLLLLTLARSDETLFFSMGGKQVGIQKSPQMETVESISFGPEFEGLLIRRIWVDRFFYPLQRFPQYSCRPGYYLDSSQKCQRCEMSGCLLCLPETPNKCEDENDNIPESYYPPLGYDFATFNSTSGNIAEKAKKGEIELNPDSQINCDQFQGCLISSDSSYTAKHLKIPKSYSMIVWVRIFHSEDSGAIKLLNDALEIDTLEIGQLVEWKLNFQPHSQLKSEINQPTWMSVACTKSSSLASLFTVLSKDAIKSTHSSLRSESPLQINQIRMLSQTAPFLIKEMKIFGNTMSELEIISEILEYSPLEIMALKIGEILPQDDSVQFDLEFGDNFIGVESQILPQWRGNAPIRATLGRSEQIEPERDPTINQEGILEFREETQQITIEGGINIERALTLVIYFTLPEQIEKARILMLNSNSGSVQIELEYPNRVIINSKKYVTDLELKSEDWNRLLVSYYHSEGDKPHIFEIAGVFIAEQEFAKLNEISSIQIGPYFKGASLKRIWIDSFLHGQNWLPQYSCPQYFYLSSDLQCLQCEIPNCQKCNPHKPNKCEDPVIEPPPPEQPTDPEPPAPEHETPPTLSSNRLFRTFLLCQSTFCVFYTLLVLFIHLVFYPQEVRFPFGEHESLKSTLSLFKLSFLITAPFVSLLAWTHSAYNIYLRIWLFIGKLISVLAVAVLLTVQLQMLSSGSQLLITICVIACLMTPNSLAFRASIRIKGEHASSVIPSIFSQQGISNKKAAYKRVWVLHTSQAGILGFAGFLGFVLGGYTMYYYGKLIDNEQLSRNLVVAWVVGILGSFLITVVKSLFSAAFLARTVKKDVCEKIFVDATVWSFVVSLHHERLGNQPHQKLKEIT